MEVPRDKRRWLLRLWHHLNPNCFREKGRFDIWAWRFLNPDCSREKKHVDIWDWRFWNPDCFVAWIAQGGTQRENMLTRGALTLFAQHSPTSSHVCHTGSTTQFAPVPTPLSPLLATYATQEVHQSLLQFQLHYLLTGSTIKSCPIPSEPSTHRQYNNVYSTSNPIISGHKARHCPNLCTSKL